MTGELLSEIFVIKLDELVGFIQCEAKPRREERQGMQKYGNNDNEHGPEEQCQKVVNLT